MKAHKRSSLTPTTTSRLVQCPCCQRHVHTLLLDSHLERECQVTAEGAWSERPPAWTPPMLDISSADATAPSIGSYHAPEAGLLPTPTPEVPPPPPPPPPTTEAAEANATVRCPICNASLRNEDAFAHVEACTGGASSSSGPSTSDLSAPSSDGATRQCMHCPACNAVCEGLAALNAHLDEGCVSPPLPSPPGPAAGSSSEAADTADAVTAPVARAQLDRLAQDLKCSLCFDLFDDPQTLPCQHSFCGSCLDQCFKVTATMACPLCKAPMWRRQVMNNRTLAHIVATFRDIHDAPAGAPGAMRGASSWVSS